MNQKYIFRKIEKEEIPIMFNLILERMKWMDEKKINHWNVLKYDNYFPISFYEKQFQKGNIFVLANSESNEIVSAAVLLENDENWNDNEPSIYVHNFVSKVGKSTGRIFMKYVENYANSKGKKYIRLDSSKDNEKLTKYYENQGFVPAGTCGYREYKGVLRQKEL